MYIKYRLQKKQVSTNNGQTWTDVSPLETRKGSVIGTYNTYSDCMSGTPTPYANQYLTIESLSNNNTVYFFSEFSGNTKTISASTDGGNTWTEYTSSTGGSGTTIATLNTGGKVLIKGLNSSYGESPTSAGFSNIFRSSNNFNVYGNIMSLISGDSFTNVTTFPANTENTFIDIFRDASKLISAGNLILPATTLTTTCYYRMFMNCTSLTTAPELPATTLAWSCYNSMFNGCTSLTTAPELPATTLANYCYSYMFEDCTSLTTAPALPATTLIERCYYRMFRGCTSLNYIKCLATDISASNCTYNWVNNVASSGTFVKASSMNDWISGASGIPNNWTVQNA